MSNLKLIEKNKSSMLITRIKAHLEEIENLVFNLGSDFPRGKLFDSTYNILVILERYEQQGKDIEATESLDRLSKVMEEIVRAVGSK